MTLRPINIKYAYILKNSLGINLLNHHKIQFNFLSATHSTNIRKTVSKVDH